MNRLFKFLIRISSFISKELIEIFRQPRLILTLVLGPFLIMFLFGLGYPDQNRKLRTTFVVEDAASLPGDMQQLLTGSISPAIINQGIENNQDLALAKLALNQTDLVIMVPPNAMETVKNNQQAKFVVYHNEVDPFQIAYIQSVARIYVDDVNRSLLQSVTEEGQANAGNVQKDLESAISKTQALKQALPPGDPNTAQVTDLEKDLTNVHDQLTTFRSLGSSVLVNPFNAETNSLSNIIFTPTEFFAPAVIVLLLQHLSITFASLSIVREQRSGIIELFRVAPLSAFETLVGKFISYLLFETLLAGVITALVVFALKVPMFGNWWTYAAAVVVLLFTSLSVGFFISLISQTDTQAVQYSMLLLLASIFFSGFFLDLRLMWEPMKVLAWSLPATYGIRMLQDIMLRGASFAPTVFQGLLLIGVVLFIVNWLLLRRRMDSQYS